MKNLIAVVCGASLLIGCTTMRPVTKGTNNAENSAETIQERISVGDQVWLTTKDNDQHELQVTVITDSTLIGIACDDCVPVSVALTTIEELRVEKISPLKTGASGVAIFYGVILVLFLASGGPGLFSPGL